MPPKLKRLSGREVIAILQRFGFAVHSSRGSHVKLRRTTAAGEKQTLTIVTRGELDVGTLQAIFRQASRFIPEEDLCPQFHSQ